jgi:predicted enzyme related to lactoylglutathione lyase
VLGRIAAAGGEVLGGLYDLGPAGRSAVCWDAVGAEFAIWQPGRRLGAQLVNAPNTWNFSNLHAGDPERALAFYAEVFGWEADSLDIGGETAATLWRRPGFGDHLEATADPGIRERQQGAPAGFEDAIAWLEALGPGEEVAHWQVSFTVADRASALATAERLGAFLNKLYPERPGSGCRLNPGT